MMKPGAFAKKQKCECCENPWNLADGERSASTVDCEEHVTGIDPKNFDNSVNPVDDFYSWSNGGWKKNNPIPAAYPRWGVFNVLNDVNQDRLKEILDELEKGEVSGGNSVTAEEKEERKKLCDFYNSFMKEEAVEESGLKDLNNHLQRAFGVSTANKHEVIADLHKIDVSVLFGLYSSPDKDDSSHTMAHFSQSGLGLPDRDYYFDSDKKEKREKYILYMESLFKELSTSSVEGVSEAYSTTTQQRAAAKQVYDFEKLLAEVHLTKTEARDVDRTFNKMTLAELNKLITPDMTWGQYLTKGRLDQDRDVFNFETYLSHFGKSDADIGVINVRTVDALKRVGSCVESAIVSGALKHYLAFHIIDSFAPYLSSNFLNLHFNFFQKELLGTKELKPRWKRALDAQENLLGEAMGKLYVSKFFKAESKQKALRVVELVRDALRERLGEVEWMCDETRKEANKKMESFVVKIGYPDKFQNYEALTAITSDSSLAKNMMAGREFHFQLDLSRMNTPTDRGRWFMSPQTINAYYHPMLNEIVFPAAILQPPFFDTDADEAVQFGSLGCVVGHEMTHGFDDKGRKFDSIGSVRDWWVGDDGEEYERRAKKMIEQASKHSVHGHFLKGELTQGENIADLGGVKLSLRALNKQLAALESPPPLINGFTPHQRFFLAWSQAWRQNATEEYAISMVTLDPHGPSELRCNNTLANIPEFLAAFNVKPSDPMGKYSDSADQVDIW